MKKAFIKRLIALMLSLILAMSVFSGVFTVSAACSHSYTYTLTKAPSESADGSRHGVCTLCGDEVDEVIEGMLTDINFTPDADYNYGTTHDVIGAVLPDQPAPDTAVDFVEDLGGKIGNEPGNTLHNTTVLSRYLSEQKKAHDNSLVEVVSHIKFPEGDFYFYSIPVNITYDDAWVYHGRFTLDGIKGKTRIVMNDVTGGDYGLFKNPTNQYSMMYTTFTDIEFTTASYLQTGKPSSRISFIDGGRKTGGSDANLPMNLYQFKAINCVISGFKSIFVGCSSITGPYISNSDFIDFGDTFFQGCGLVDMKVTNNVIRGFGYETDAGYEPSYFQAQSNYCSGIISNNKLYNMQFDGENRAGRYSFTGEVVTPFANNYCERVYGVSGIQTVTGNDFTKCSKQDMIDFLETRGTVSQTYLDQTVCVNVMPAVANRFSSDDMTGTYLASTGCGELLDNAYSFGKIGVDHLYYSSSAVTNGDDVNIDLSMFPLKYVPPASFPSGTHLNLNGKSVYSRFRKNNSNSTTYGNTSLFDEYGNDVGYIAEAVPAPDEWENKNTCTYDVLSDGRLHIKANRALSGTGVASFTIDNIDTTLYRRYFLDNSKIELLNGDYTKIAYSVSFFTSSGTLLSSVPVTTQNASDYKYVSTGISGYTAPVMGKMIVTLQLTSPVTSASNPLEVIIPPVEIERYDGFSTGKATTLNTFKTATDYSVVGADYDELYAAADEVSSFASPDEVEKVYFNETYGHLRTVTINGTKVPNDTHALQIALNDIKDSGKELVIEEDSYNLMFNMSLAKNGYKSGSLYFEGGHTYRIRALGESNFSFKSDMDSGAFFYQKGEGTVSGYMINIDTGKPFQNVEKGAVFHGINFKNFVIDNSILCGAYSLFENCTFDSSIYQNGYVAKSNKIFNNTTVTNSAIINNYVHIGWVSAEGIGQENAMDAGWLFYDSAFLNSTYQDNWCEYMRFNNGGWYEKNGYKASNSLYTGNILDYTVEIRLGYGDIAIGNGNYHASKWDLLYNDKGVSNMTYDINNRSVGTYHISSGVTVIGNSFTTTQPDSPAIYFEGKTNASNANGTKAIKNATVFGNKYTYGINSFDEQNDIFAIEGELLDEKPNLMVDAENNLYDKLDAKGSTGNYFDFANVNYHTAPNYHMPGTIIQSGDVMGVLGYSDETGKVEILTPTGAVTGLRPLSADMFVDFEPLAYYNNGNVAWPELTIKDGDYELKHGVDYIVTASNNNIRPDGLFRIDGMGKYYGSIKYWYEITKAPIELANVKLSFDTAEYDGTDKKPTVLYVYYNHTDISGQCSVSYSDHTALGTAYVTLTANSSSTNFTGSKRIAYNVHSDTVSMEKQSTVAPTCTAEGYTTYLCPHCSKVIKTDYTAALGHDMQVSSKKDATCTATGHITYTCANGCGTTQTETLDAISHVNRFYETPATCTKSGESGRKCIICGGNKVISETFAAKGHGKTYENIVSGNCQTAGQLQKICEDCGEVVSSTSLDIDASAHDWVISTVKTAATCTASGIADATCSVCGTHDANAVIPATGHTAGDVVIIGGERVRKCTVCGEVCNRQYVYDWDFTDASGAEEDAAELKELSGISINTSDNFYNSEFGSYILPFTAAGNSNVTVFTTPENATPKTFDITTTGDTYNNCVTTPGVIFADDENGVYAYSVYMNASSSVTEALYYIPYVKSGAEITGLSTPLLLMENAVNIATVYREVDGRLEDVSDIYSTFGFKPGAPESKYATYDYHLTVSGNSVTVYADIHFNFDLVENADPITFDLVSDEKTFSLDSITRNAGSYYSGGFTNKTHDEFKPSFGVYQYTRDTITTAYQQGIGEVKGATLTYTSAVDCSHPNTYKGNSVDPTCLKPGKYVDAICLDCGAIVVSGETIDALGHDYIVNTVEPTCTEAGTQTTTCSRCDYNEVINLSATGHNISDFRKTTVAKCEVSGVETAECSGCGKVVNRYSKPLGHVYDSWVVVTPATATSSGKKQGTCSVCGKVITETILSNKYKEYDWDYSDRASGKANADSTAQNVTYIDTSKGNYSTSAYHYYNADTRTLDVKTVNAHTQVALITPDSGYEASTFSLSAYGESFWNYSNTPGIIIAENADYYYYLQVYFMRQDLYYNVRGIKKSALTESSDGKYGISTSYITKNKSAVKINGVKVNGTTLSTATNNIVKLLGADNLTQYTTSDGATVAYGLPLTFKYDVSVTGSKIYLNTTIEHYNESTGETTTVELTKLTVNNSLFGLTGTEITPVFGYVAAPSNNPYDCYVTENTGICKINYINAVYAAGSDAHIHEYTAGTSVEATCTEPGYTVYSCSCGDSYNLSTSSALGHNTTTTTKAATCTQKGSTTSQCSRCDYTSTTEIDALGHDYVATTIDATCTTAGSKTTTCSRCDYTSTTEVDALGHDYVVSTTEATCTAKGSTTTTCTRCDYENIIETDMLDHTESDWITDKEATSTTAGSKYTECTVCGKVLQEETIPATGSDLVYGDANGDGLVNIIDATIVSRCSAGLLDLTAINSDAADVNGNGEVNVFDAVIIARYAAGLINKFPVDNTKDDSLEGILPEDSIF